MISPVGFVSIEVITAPYSAIISWVTPYIAQDKETYTVQLSTDVILWNSSKIVIEVTNDFVFNQNFSVNITGLIPFTTYYYIIQANNSVGITSTDIMIFSTNQTGMGVIIAYDYTCSYRNIISYIYVYV